MTNDVDSQARAEAAKANQRINDHEESCKQRYVRFNAALDANNEELKRLPWRIVRALSVISLMFLSAIGALVFLLLQRMVV